MYQVSPNQFVASFEKTYFDPEIIKNNILNIPEQVVNDYLIWSKHNIPIVATMNKKEITFTDVKNALIRFMMYSYYNPDNYLVSFIDGNCWYGFEIEKHQDSVSLLYSIYGLN
jgi:hypothetical protein